MDERSLIWGSLLLLLLASAALRLYPLDWDGGIGAHPDERYIVGVAEGLRWPGRLSPYDVDPSFPYGHLPVYLLALVNGLAGGGDPLPVGRAVAALLDVGTVALTFALGQHVAGARVGLFAAACVALMVLHIQNAHFYTADVPLTFLVMGALFFAVRLAKRGRALDAGLAGLATGLALGTKATGALLVLPLTTACAGAAKAGGSRWRCALGSGLVGLVAFAATNPSALLALPIFWRNVSEQAAVARGVLDVPYTRQFHAAWPYLYPVVQLLRWDMGWLPGLVALGGLACAAWRALWLPLRREQWVLLAWAVPTLAFFGVLYVQFPRYLLPLTPLLAVYGAQLLVGDAQSRKTVDSTNKLARMLILRVNARHRKRLRAKWWPRLVVAAVLVSALFRCLAFTRLYRAPHPWLAASDWFNAQVPSDAVIAVEQWDHPLPLAAEAYDLRELPVFDEDTPEKWTTVTDTLAEADYVIIASRRGYATLARWPARYPLTARYYQLLFEGALGFEPVACFGRHPHLGPLALADDPTAGLGFSLPTLCRPGAPLLLQMGRLDESSVVYDHPQSIVFRRTALAPEPSEMRRLIGESANHE